MGAKDVPNGKGSKQMGVISFVLGLVGGTGGSIITKILFTMQAEGVNGEIKPFEVIIASGEGVTDWDAPFLCRVLIFLSIVFPPV